MATVGHINAEVLLKIDGMEGTYSVGHLEIPVNISTDEKRPLHANLRVDTSGVARSLEGALEERRAAASRNLDDRKTKEN